MRKAIELLSLAVLVGMMGCAKETAEESTKVRSPARDLTLREPAPPVVAVASPVELGRPVAHRAPASKIARQRARIVRSAQPAPAPAPAPETAEPMAVPVAVSAPAPEPVADAAPAGAGRELAPGETVTVIPASAGPSSSDGDELNPPVEHARRGIFIGHGGGTCRPRGGVRGFRISF